MPHSGSSTTAEAPVPATIDRFATDVREGLTRIPKQLPPEYFYDELGSALFEAITVLPEYGLTRADSRILRRHAEDIAALAPLPIAVLELGCGSGTKTAHVLRAISRRQGSVAYYPIDVSGTALDHCTREMSKIAEVHPVHGTFVEGVAEAVSAVPKGHHVMLLFLGSTIGNFDRGAARELLARLCSLLKRRDTMLIGADLIKPAAQLIAAYDDPVGVTAAFNVNLLARMNRELGADFDLRRFHHEARYNAAEKRIEMHLVSMADQRVTIPRAACSVQFSAGESIWTESSHKYHLADLEAMAAGSGFRILNVWTDSDWPFAESLWEAAG